MEPKCVSQLFLGSLLGKCRSTIGHFFPSLVTVPEVFAKVYSAQFSSLSKVANYKLGSSDVWNIYLLVWCSWGLFHINCRHHTIISVMRSWLHKLGWHSLSGWLNRPFAQQHITTATNTTRILQGFAFLCKLVVVVVVKWSHCASGPLVKMWAC